MTNDTCTLPECDKPIKRKGYCYGHYMKVWRYGTPHPPHGWVKGSREHRQKISAARLVDIRGQRFGTPVVRERIKHQWLCDCDCGGQRLASAGELNRSGDASTCGNRTVHCRRPDAGYVAAHERCRSDRGKVQHHACIDCGKPAQHWSYNHDDEDERYATGLSNKPIAYSLDPSHYSPRCVSCHKIFDLGRADALTPLGAGPPRPPRQPSGRGLARGSTRKNETR